MGSNRAIAKTLTKKKLQEFDKVNPPQNEAYRNKRIRLDAQQNMGGEKRSLSDAAFEELSEEGKEACLQLLTIFKRAHSKAVYPVRKPKVRPTLAEHAQAPQGEPGVGQTKRKPGQIYHG